MTRLRATSQVISTKTISSGPHSAGRATASPCRCEPGGRNGHPLRVMPAMQDAFYRSLGEGTAPDATPEHRPDPDRLPISPATLPAARAPSAAAPGGSERQRALLRAEHRGPGDPARDRHGYRHVDRTCHRPSGGSFGHGPQRALRCPPGRTDRLHGTGSRVRAEPGPRRYESRRADTVDEANAIGTAYLRAQTLAEPVRTETLDLFPRYTE